MANAPKVFFYMYRQDKYDNFFDAKLSNFFISLSVVFPQIKEKLKFISFPMKQFEPVNLFPCDACETVTPIRTHLKFVIIYWLFKASKQDFLKFDLSISFQTISSRKCQLFSFMF